MCRFKNNGFKKILLIIAVISFLIYGLDFVLQAEEVSLEKTDLNKSLETISEAEAGPKSLEIDMSQRITLDLRNMEVVDALKYLTLRSGMNIVSSKMVSGRVTLQLKDVSIQDIFDIVLLSNNLAYKKKGDIYYVMTDKEYETLYGETFTDTRTIRMFRLKFIIPQKAFELVDLLKSKIGRVLVDPETGTILVMDTPEKIAEMEKVLAIAEEKPGINVFSLQYAKAKDIESQLKGQLVDKNLGSVSSDERSNQVVVQTLPERMNDVQQLINALDKKTKEVLIDTKLIKIKVSDDYIAGFQWEGMFKQLSQAGDTKFYGSHPLESVLRGGKTFVDTIRSFNTGGQYTQKTDYSDGNPTAGGKTNLTENVFFGSASGKNAYEILFNYLKTLGETRLLSNPKLAVTNNQEANIHVGRKEAYITTTTTTGQTTTTTAEEVQFVDVGIILHVTPTINDNGYVTMIIKPEVSSVVDWLVTPSGNKVPIVDTALAETTVMVKDGATIIIGGLRRQEEQETIKRVPGLSKIPILGKVFTSKSKGQERNELLVMITPNIISGDIIVTGDVEGRPGNEPAKDYKDYETAQQPMAETFEENLEFKTYRDY